jgi:hypothetical protein
MIRLVFENILTSVCEDPVKGGRRSIASWAQRSNSSGAITRVLGLGQQPPSALYISRVAPELQSNDAKLAFLSAWPRLKYRSGGESLHFDEVRRAQSISLHLTRRGCGASDEKSARRNSWSRANLVPCPVTTQLLPLSGRLVHARCECSLDSGWTCRCRCGVGYRPPPRRLPPRGLARFSECVYTGANSRQTEVGTWQ